MNCIVVVFGTRPEFIKLFPVIKELKKIKETKTIVINANQQPDLLEPLLKHFAFEADYKLQGVNDGSLLERTQKMSSQLNIEIEKILSRNPIDFILAQGDTNSVLAASIVSRYNGIKFAHVEAGLRSFSYNDPYPEELNRKMAGHNAEVHFAPDKTAVTNLQNEGIKKNVILTGNTVVDFLKLNFKRKREKRNTVIITQHRRNSKEHRADKILNICIGLANKYPNYNFVWINHPSSPNTKQSELQLSNFKTSSPLNTQEILQLYNKTAIIITDSGGMQEEGMSLGIPVLVTRNFTERQAGVLWKKSFLAGSYGEKLESLFDKVISKWNYTESRLFGTGNASIKIRQWFEKYFKQKTIYDVAFLGFGPAGSGVIINMFQRKQISRLKKSKILILDKSEYIIKGNITSYYINSDTYAKTFSEFVGNVSSKSANSLANKSSYKKINAIDGNIALKGVEEFLTDASAIYSKAIKEFKNTKLRSKEIALQVVKYQDGIFNVKSVSDEGSFFREHEYSAKKIVIACGGTQNRMEIISRCIGKTRVNLINHAEKVVFTDDLFRAKQNAMLVKNKKPSILIIGSSHSAFMSVVYLKKYFNENNIAEYNIHIMYRSMPKPFFLTLEEAHKNGFTDYNMDDTCPITGRVNRLSGLRFEARELFLNLLKDCERGIRLSEIPADENDLIAKLSETDIIIPAFGYVPNAVEMVNGNGENLGLNIGIGKRFVNDKCQVLDANEKVIENVFGIGLASGFVPSGKLGGEKNFKGQTNGYWLYQNGVGEIIADQIFNL